MQPEISYKPGGKTLREFMLSDIFVRGLRGPVGSGKTACCCVEVFRRAMQQAKAPDGKRYSRWAIVRNSYPELRTTTIKTWLDWFPEDQFGKMTWHPTPYCHHIKMGELDMEVWFIALDKPDDVKKLLSLELTGAFINEAREVSKTIIDGITMRVGRYPSRRIGGPSWYGIIMDTNAPDDEHWWPVMAGETPIPDYLTEDEARMMVKPEDWIFFNQPGALKPLRKDDKIVGYKPNPDAENVQNLPPDYYEKIITGKDQSWINVYVLNQLGAIRSGKVIYPNFVKDVHVAKEELEVLDSIPLAIGLDFGLTPCAIICQPLRGIWRIMREVIGNDIGAANFAMTLKAILSTDFPGLSYRIWGDPTGDNRSQNSEDRNHTPFRIFAARGLSVVAAPTNDPVIRVESVKQILDRMVVGRPAMVIDPRCRVLIKGFEDSYCYRRLQVSGERYADEPDKNKFSHVHDALQYVAVGMGEGRELLGAKSQQPARTEGRRSVFDRLKGRPRQKAPTRFGVFN